MTELTALRTYTSKTHDNGDGTKTFEAHAGHIHYDNAGTLEDVDLTFEDMGTYWRVTKASYKLYVAKDFGAADLIRFDNRYEGANHSIYYEPHSIWWINTDNKSERTKWKDAQSVTGTLNAGGNIITWVNAFGAGVDFEVTLKRSGFTKEIVINSKPPTGGAPYTNWALGAVFRWTADGLTLSDGLSDWGNVQYYESGERLEVREAGGLKSYIQKAYGIDSSTPAMRVELPVFFEKSDGKLWQGKLISSALIENATYPARMDTTSTYYPGSGDGSVSVNDVASWTLVHDATAGDTVKSTDTSVYVNSQDWGTKYWQERAFIPFDTSGIPDGATISAATFYVTVGLNGNGNVSSNEEIRLVQTSQADVASLVTGDYDQCGAVDNPTEGSDSRFDTTSWVLGTEKSLALNSTGLGWIDKTGWTKLGLREEWDASDTDIGAAGDNYHTPNVYLSERTGTGEDPRLEVTYTAGATRRIFITSS